MDAALPRPPPLRPWFESHSLTLFSAHLTPLQAARAPFWRPQKPMYLSLGNTHGHAHKAAAVRPDTPPTPLIRSALRALSSSWASASVK
eukprot:CAMPEP_0119365732 /NCGR_PEP_ID=MMETSP1334-20130426/12643_1 /TAXON_ID=127549 /ORGANISM="Calcidiscus leptoporus, Strain RCC1130" /LENGTH=88 /DNA_ID=CAMNT_0007381773 /DNA_START=83 /DNA_END=346 /DNA_ORIENTATION=+